MAPHIERYRRRESSVEEALIEMYLAGISVRRVEDITEALWGTRVSPSTVSNLNKKIYAKIEAWRNRRIEGEQSGQTRSGGSYPGEAITRIPPIARASHPKIVGQRSHTRNQR